MNRPTATRLIEGLTSAALAVAALAACSSGGPYVRAVNASEARTALSSLDGKLKETAGGTVFRQRLTSVDQYTGPCKPSGNPCENIWCYTLNLQTQETVGGKITWVPGPDFKGCKYIDVDLHPTPGTDGLRVDAVPAYLEQELMAKGLISSKPAG